MRTLSVTQAHKNAAKMKKRLNESKSVPFPEMKKIPEISPIPSPTHSSLLKVVRKITTLSKAAKMGEKVVVMTPALPAFPKFIA